jgi:hypothetical protein
LLSFSGDNALASCACAVMMPPGDEVIAAGARPAGNGGLE